MLHYSSTRVVGAPKYIDRKLDTATYRYQTTSCNDNDVIGYRRFVYSTVVVTTSNWRLTPSHKVAENT